MVILFCENVCKPLVGDTELYKSVKIKLFLGSVTPVAQWNIKLETLVCFVIN